MITRIREVRKAKALTLDDVAQRCSPPTTAQTIGRLETGTRTVSVGWLNRIAAALGVAHRKIPMGETYMVDHTAAVFAIDPQGRRAAVFTPPLDATQIASDLELLAASRG